MTNHNPTFTSSNATGSFSENSNTTGSTAAHALSGTMNFTDSDHSDTHTTSATLKTVSWAGGTIPTLSRNDLNAAMTSSILSDSNGSGKISWNFSAPDKDFDFLAKNETLVLTYELKVSDNHGGSTTHTVTITITGTDDKPVITMGASAIVNEQANHSLSLSFDTAHIALSFTDPDLDNTGHTATVTGVSATGNTSGILPGSLGTAELMSFFDINNVVKNSGSSSGTINTTFSAPDLAFDYLGAGQTVTITYVVQLDDHAGGVSTQNVTVTVVGTNDAPAYICGPEFAHLVEGQNLTAGNLTAHGDLLFGDLDLSDTHTVSVAASATKSGGGAVPLTNAQLLAAMHTTLDDSNGTLLGDVAWNFAIADSSVNFLQAGETLTITYNITIKDPSNATDTETVTITILGTNHPVVITSGAGIRECLGAGRHHRLGDGRQHATRHARLHRHRHERHAQRDGNARLVELVERHDPGRDAVRPRGRARNRAARLHRHRQRQHRLDVQHRRQQARLPRRRRDHDGRLQRQGGGRQHQLHADRHRDGDRIERRAGDHQRAAIEHGRRTGGQDRILLAGFDEPGTDRDAGVQRRRPQRCARGERVACLRGLVGQSGLPAGVDRERPDDGAGDDAARFHGLGVGRCRLELQHSRQGSRFSRGRRDADDHLRRHRERRLHQLDAAGDDRCKRRAGSARRDRRRPRPLPTRPIPTRIPRRPSATC